MVGMGAPVFATSTTINAQVRDGQPASLTITTDIEGKTVHTPTVTVEGSVHNVTQIVVYVDEVYNTSVPLAIGADTYVVAFGVTPGTHSVRFAGLDAYTATEVSQTVSFTYDPTSTGAGNSDGEPSSPVDTYLQNTIDAARATGGEAAQQVQRASSSGPLGALSDIAFNVFKSVDLLSTTDGTGVNKMAGRFTLVSAGLAATVFPMSALGLVEKVRFIPKPRLPAGALTPSIRAFGIVLMLIPFVFLH